LDDRLSDDLGLRAEDLGTYGMLFRKQPQQILRLPGAIAESIGTDESRPHDARAQLPA
jgi:hypothetical protein